MNRPPVAGGGDAQQQLLSRARPVALTWFGIASAAAAVVILSTGPPEVVAGDVGWLIGLTVLVVVAASLEFPVFVGRVHQGSGLNELGLLPAILLLEPSLAIAVAVVGGLIAEWLLTRQRTDGRWLKIALNLSWQTLGVALAASLLHVLTVPGFVVTPVVLLVAVAGAAIIVAVNITVMSTFQSRTTGQPLGWVLRDHGASATFTGFAAGATGILAVVLVVEVPVALPLLLVPILVYRGSVRDRSEGVRQLHLERDRFVRTVEGASHGVVFVGQDGRIEVWNPAVEHLSGTDAESAVGQHLDELGWGGAYGDPTGSGTTVRRITIQGRSLEVRQSDLAGGQGAVLSIRDVSREVELARVHEDLVSRISHELRTPLTTAEGFLETLEARWEALDPDARRDLVRAAKRGAARLSGLVDRLLIWSRIEARAGATAAEDDLASGSDVGRVLPACLTEVSDVDVDVGATAGQVIIVPMAESDLATVITQLIDNARLYGRPPICVVLGSDEWTVELRVSDHGAGLPGHLASQVFEPFRQGTEGLQRTGQGLGLGLAIVHRLVVASGGEIELTSTHDAPTSFSVTLPRLHPEWPCPSERAAG